MFLCLKKEEEMKTIDIVNAYNVLNAAKLAKMQDTDKFTVIRAMRALKPIQADYEAAVRDAQERLKPEDFERVLNLNLLGTVIPTQVFLKAMVEQKQGCIVNFSSMAAFRPLTRVCGYAAAKAGISNFTAFMANEVATKFGEGIRVNAIAPGFFLTEQNRTLLTNPDGSYTQRGLDVIRQTPFKRFGVPEELNGTIQYLISDASKFVTGTVAVVDGGFNVFAM